MSRPKEGWEQLDDAMLAHLRSLPPAPLAKCPDCGCQLEGGTNCGCSHPCHLAADGTGSGELEGP